MGQEEVIRLGNIIHKPSLREKVTSGIAVLVGQGSPEKRKNDDELLFRPIMEGGEDTHSPTMDAFAYLDARSAFVRSVPDVANGSKKDQKEKHSALIRVYSKLKTIKSTGFEQGEHSYSSEEYEYIVGKMMGQITVDSTKNKDIGRYKPITLENLEFELGTNVVKQYSEEAAKSSDRQDNLFLLYVTKPTQYRLELLAGNQTLREKFIADYTNFLHFTRDYYRTHTIEKGFGHAENFTDVKDQIDLERRTDSPKSHEAVRYPTFSWRVGRMCSSVFHILANAGYSGDAANILKTHQELIDLFDKLPKYSD